MALLVGLIAVGCVVWQPKLVRAAAAPGGTWPTSAGHSALPASPLPSVTSLSADEAARQADAADRRRDPRCAALYAWAALQTWPVVITSSSSQDQPQAWTLYHDSLEKMLAAGLKYRQLDPQRGLELQIPGGGVGRITVNRNGFIWQAEDFNEFQPAGTASGSKLSRYWQQPGIGVPLVVLRRRGSDRDFHGKAIPFPATALLRPMAAYTPAQLSDLPHGAVIGVLELYDPLRVEQIRMGAVTHALARNTSAPFALVVQQANRDNWQAFLRPGQNGAEAELRMLEPYQAGKIPLVLVHGLLSDKFTWIPLVNDLRNAPWVNHHYQIWTFQYPTGQPFLQSGADLREALRDVSAIFDPRRADPAQRQIVLIGHSMGGLVSKLQVTHSGSLLWDQVASRPLSEIRAQPQQRDQLSKMFFFEPTPSVKRVVFIGTPHLGSFWAESLYGRLGSSLVRLPQGQSTLLASLMKDNSNVFNKNLRNGMPTSVDLLKPDNPLLIGLARLPVHPDVKLHSIVGNGTPYADGTPADGVVSMDSARHPGAASERFVNATHSDLPDHPDTVAEVLRILAEHLQQFHAVPTARP